MTTNAPPLATTITGSLPRPQWFTENLRGRPFLTAMGSDLSYREQYSDAVAALIGDELLVIPPNVEHWGEVVGEEPVINLDVFTPRRPEYA